MTDEKLIRNLSRRQVLAGVGTLGLASAGAGLGTTAFLRDTEEFGNNTLAAGQFDLKVDWEEHYYDESTGDFEGLDNDVLSLDGDPGDVPENYVGLPTPSTPMVAVHVDDLGQFMDNTSIEAYPDTDDDGVQDAFAAEPGATTEDGVGYICADGADTQDDLDPTVADALRTANEDTLLNYEEWAANPAETEPDVAPLFNLSDVKPGDCGETTLSYHLCGNPGYIWLIGGLGANAENGFTEPEANHSTDSTQGEGELLDAIQTRVWHDDGDNVAEVGSDDRSWLTEEQSLGDLLDELDSETGIQLCHGDGDAQTCANVSGPVADTDAVVDHSTGEEVIVEQGGEDTTIEIGGNPDCGDFGFGDGFKLEAEAGEGDGHLPSSGTQTYSTPYGDLTVTVEPKSNDDEPKTVTSWSLDSAAGYCVAKVIVKGGNAATVYSYDQNDTDNDFTDGQTFGAASHTDADLENPGQQAISHVSFCIAPGSGDECCFEPSTDHYLGLAWWVPPEVGNEIQSDSVSFGVGFYAEQCRHNA